MPIRVAQPAPLVSGGLLLVVVEVVDGLGVAHVVDDVLAL
jgi:hypothetical protein